MFFFVNLLPAGCAPCGTTEVKMQKFDFSPLVSLVITTIKKEFRLFCGVMYRIETPFLSGCVHHLVFLACILPSTMKTVILKRIQNAVARWFGQNEERSGRNGKSSACALSASLKRWVGRTYSRYLICFSITGETHIMEREAPSVILNNGTVLHFIKVIFLFLYITK
ncbi:hypothetical protein TcG_01048 [Trypanosoma cruzi]|nr:hypothetical protein TcG_01048 [Trypanosoma cruzi]